MGSKLTYPLEGQRWAILKRYLCSTAGTRHQGTRATGRLNVLSHVYSAIHFRSETTLPHIPEQVNVGDMSSEVLGWRPPAFGIWGAGKFITRNYATDELQVDLLCPTKG
jgi:hypothetical protein